MTSRERLGERLPKPLRGALLFIAILALSFGVLASGHEPTDPRFGFWAIAIGAAIFVTESFPIQILYRREATSFSMFEVPLIVGVLVLPGWQTLAAVTVGITGALSLVRKQPFVKLLFNVPNLLLHASVTTLVFDLVRPEPGFGPDAVVAAIFAGLIGSVLASAMIALIVRASEGVLEVRKTLDMLAFAALVGISNSSLAMIGLKLGTTEPWAVALLAVPLVVGAGAYRALVSERRQREQLQFLLSATTSLTADLGRTDSFEALLTETAAMFRASRVELVIFDNADAVEAPLRCSLKADQVTIVELDEALDSLHPVADGLRAPLLLLNSNLNRGTLTSWLDELEVEDVLIAPLRSGAGDIGLFVVADRVGAASTFGSADLELFSTLSLQVGTALENDRLGQALMELRKLEAELSHLAVHDTLTGLPNRLGLRRYLEETSGDDVVDLLFMDLDDFKIVNDTLGHGSGDELLIEVADRIRDSLRQGDFAARLGGDEFAICVPGQQTGVRIAERLVESISQPTVIDGTTVSVGCSIGVATSEPYMDAVSMLRRADVAMYSAKAAGKNRVRCYTDQMDAELIERQRLLNEIREAVTNDEFRIHYQPIFELESTDGSPVGAEALVRWETEDGLLSPGQFLPLAEESDLIVEIDRWVFGQVIADAPSHKELDWVSVNLSARHVQEDDVVDWLIDTTRAAGVDPARIILEITETAVMADIELSIAKLDRLRAEGFRLALDDFGTGHSSIAYLRELPFSVLKIAQPFVGDMNKSGRPTFVKAIIDLAHTLGLPVVAEGVETLDQLSSLRALGCDLAQGYLLARPTDLEGFLARRVTAS